MQVHLRQHIRTPLKCTLVIIHPDLDDFIAITTDLSDTGVFIKHPSLARLAVGDVVHGQVQEMPTETPLLMMEVMRVTPEGAGLRFIQE